MIRDEATLDQFLATISRFVRERLVPIEAQVAEDDHIPDDIVQAMRDMGLYGMTLPEEYGGLGLTMEEEVRVLFEFCKTSPAFRSLVGTNNGIGGQGILLDGTPEQKARWLPKLASGEVTGSFALTEPEAGSDAASLRTSARRDGDFYVLNGVKRFITNAPRAQHFYRHGAHGSRDERRRRHHRLHRRAQGARPVARQARQEDGPARRPYLRRDFRGLPRAGGKRHRRARGRAASRPR